MAKIYNNIFFYFLIIVFLLGFITSYLLVYFLIVVGRIYLPIDYNILYITVFVFVYLLSLILISFKTILWISIDHQNIVMKYLFKTRKLSFTRIEKLYVLYPLQRKPMEKRKPIGLDILLKDGHRISLGILDSKIIIEIVNVCMQHKISVVKKYYVGEESYLEDPVSSGDDFGT